MFLARMVHSEMFHTLSFLILRHSVGILASTLKRFILFLFFLLFFLRHSVGILARLVHSKAFSYTLFLLLLRRSVSVPGTDRKAFCRYSGTFSPL